MLKLFTKNLKKSRMATITIDNQEIVVDGEKSVLESALGAGIYIPHLCFHPQIETLSEEKSIEEVYQGGIAHRGDAGETFEGCNLCLVEIEGREGLFQSCRTNSEDGLVITTASPEIQKARQDNLAGILEKHPHACLLCPQREGCDRKVCSVHIPEDERCCSQFGNCELQGVFGFIGTAMGFPPYVPPNIPVLENDGLLIRDYSLCIGCMRCVRVCKEVKGADALGFVVEEGRIVVGSKNPTLKESGCQFCGYCIEVCPTGALRDRDAGVGEREKYLIPCKHTCPAGINVPSYISLIKEGEYEKALKVICERTPLPGVLGRVCFHPCEALCRRGILDQPVSICALKRTASDLGEKVYAETLFPAGEKTGKKVAIVGSGPAGLSAACYLNMLGHSVTVFEVLPEKGGMLRVGIPSYRLPRPVLDREIKCIEDAGVEIKTNQQIDSIDKLFGDGFGAVFVAVGAHKGRKLGIDGEENEGIVDGVTFLREVNLGSETSVSTKVLVIGGGNVAMDSARCALRKGAKEVTIYYRRSRDEMPAHAEEIEAALEEGIRIEYQVAPQRIEKKNGLLEVEFVRMEMGEPDESKRRRPVPIKGSEFKQEFDMIIPAIGQASELPEKFGISADVRAVNPARGVFIGGDLLSGPATVIDAIASGRRGAVLIDKFLGGKGNIDNFTVEMGKKDLWSGPDGVSIDQRRSKLPALPAEAISDNFSEVNICLNQQTATAEAKRCLGCDLRFLIKPPVLPPELWLVLAEENVKDLPKAEGVYVLYNKEKEIYQISGVENLQKELICECGKGGEAQYFSYEIDQMFTTKERQLIQQYMKKHGKMPPGNDEMDELF